MSDIKSGDIKTGDIKGGDMKPAGDIKNKSRELPGLVLERLKSRYRALIGVSNRNYTKDGE